MRIKKGFRGLFSGYCMLVDVLSRIENILQVGLREMVLNTTPFRYRSVFSVSL